MAGTNVTCVVGVGVVVVVDPYQRALLMGATSHGGGGDIATAHSPNPLNSRQAECWGVDST